MTEIDDKIKYLNDLKNETVERPSPKSKYLKLITQLEIEIAELINEKNQAEEAALEAAKQAIEEANSNQTSNNATVGQRLAALEIAILEIGELL